MSVIKPFATDFAAFLETRKEAKDGYIMGATGQRPKTLSKTSWWFTQYDGAQHTKALYWRENADRIFDCQGLAEGYLNDINGTNINTYARANYANWCDPKGTGKIPNDRKVPGAAVFYHNSNYVSHVGFLVKPVDAKKPSGDWWCIEARGVMYGVVRTKLSERSWNRWGWMTKHFDYGEDVAVPVEHKLGERVLKRGDEGEDVKQLQIILLSWQYDLGKWGADSEFGKDTEAAVKDFQEDHDLPVTGIYDEAAHTLLASLWELENDDQPPEIIQPPPPKPNLYPIHRIIPDISDNQGELNYDKFCAGTDTCIMRARVNGRNDGLFLKHAKAFNERNYPFSVYDYITPKSHLDAINLANAMYDRCNEFHPIAYFLDCEKLAEGVTYKQNRLYMGTYAARLRDRGVKLVGLYTGSNRFENEYKRVAMLYDILWIAHYGKNTGFLSNIPDSKLVSLHQYTSMAGATNKEGIRVPGAPGCKRRVDLNRLTGNMPLSKLTGRKYAGTEYYGIIRIEGDTVNIRTGAGAQFKRVAVAEKGELYSLREGSKKGWYAIQYKGSEAYVSSEFTKAVEE